MNIGVICPSEIAFRRFMPALQQVDGIEFVGIGVCTMEERFGETNVDSDTANQILDIDYKKANEFVKQYGGRVFDGYKTIAQSSEIDALYIPLPPALHYKWAKIALESGKHVFVEKPSTTSASDSAELVRIAKANDLALHENYMFAFHNQLSDINQIIESGEIGDIRLYRVSFGFPRRAANDFRYNKALGGGALIDAGGYTIKYATRLLGPSAHFEYAHMNYTKDSEVDMYGSAAMVNDDGVTVQLAFGMDNNYKCELEAWGSKGCLTTGRVLTAPADFVPSITIRKGNEDNTLPLSKDDAFKKSIEHFIQCTNSIALRDNTYQEIFRQASLIDEFKRLAGVE